MADLREQLDKALGATYRIDRELGGGGMSRVFLATETGLDRQVVIKVLPQDLAQLLNPERFEREIQIAAKLQHPHVVALLSAGQAGGVRYYVMPWIEGESLRARLIREPRPPLAETVRILRDAADGLAYAHARGIVHRDIKPENILLSGDHAVVTNFGVAQALTDGDTLQAMRRLRWTDAIIPNAEWGRVNSAIGYMSVLQRAELEAGSGLRDEAEADSRVFLRFFDDPCRRLNTSAAARSGGC